ncbi:gallate 1-beta-glucosyltransferase 84A24-like [Coffea arabica]|uniref:Glycosyltransferase n=1 Tax=Coffea arabica TaxID=13443 RepID=A0A6P6TEC7_COFAR|nr:limonoid UDP-glucosyltransferase-like [Coffea arabica]
MDSESCNSLSPNPHVFLVSFAGQGHVNPLLRLGKLLASNGLLVTLSAPEIIGAQIRKANSNISTDEPTPVGDGMIRFEFFDDETEVISDYDLYILHLEFIGKQKLPELIKKQEGEGRPVSCLIYSIFVPWVCDIAETLHIPSAAFWIESCACFSAFYHYHHGLVPFPTQAEPQIDVQLPCMPVLMHDEIPSLLHPFNPKPVMIKAILGQIKNLSKSICILMDTFQELEDDVLDYMSKLCPVKPIGPLFINPKVSSSNISVDILKADDCMGWLDSKPPSSVVYISFGSVVFLKQEQVTEIAYGLLNSGVSFLWVMKPPEKLYSSKPHVLPDGFWEKVGDKGKVVQWSPQQQVLAHPSISCFLTHCGWNSTLEALASGVPVLAFPHWGDQVTNAKYLVDEFRVGIRMCRGVAEDKIIPKEEVEKCLVEATCGPKAAEIKESALKWKKKAEEAVALAGSSNQNMQDFLNQIILRSKVKL